MRVGVLTASSRIDEPPVTIRRGDANGVDAFDGQGAGICGKIFHVRGIDAISRIPARLQCVGYSGDSF
jgi:hypothetical protein